MNTKKILGIVLCIPFFLWLVAFIGTGIIFDIDIGGHMKRAADSNTIEDEATHKEFIRNLRMW